MEVNFTDLENCCLSGGAQGADLQWGMCAGMAGHNVIHWSFDGHNTQAPLQEVVRLTEEQLQESEEAIIRTAPLVGKRPPVQLWVKRLIQRNYFQVAWSDSVYAVADIKNGIVQGGTAWAVYMYLSRPDMNTPQCYVYDQTKGSWYAFVLGDDPWVEIQSPPVPMGIWAGIGTRNLTQNGKDAIRTLLGYQPVK